MPGRRWQRHHASAGALRRHRHDARPGLQVEQRAGALENILLADLDVLALDLKNVADDDKLKNVADDVIVLAADVLADDVIALAAYVLANDANLVGPLVLALAAAVQ